MKFAQPKQQSQVIKQYFRNEREKFPLRLKFLKIH